MQADVQKLIAVKAKLSATDQQFADSLIGTAAKPWGLSDKQAYWVGRLIQRAEDASGFGTVQAEVVNVGGFSGVVDLFVKAKQKLKYPKIWMQLETGEQIALTLCGPNAKYPGSVNITDGGSYGQNKYYGRVLENGNWMVSTTTEKTEGLQAKLVTMLAALAQDPAGTAAAYGHLTGKCCFCHSTLTDEKSTAVGYGPVCAKQYDLPWGSKNVEIKNAADAPAPASVEGGNVPWQESSAQASAEDGSNGVGILEEDPAEFVKCRPSRQVKIDYTPGRACQQLMEFMKEDA